LGLRQKRSQSIAYGLAIVIAYVHSTALGTRNSKQLIAIRMSIETSGTFATAEETVLMAVDEHVRGRVREIVVTRSMLVSLTIQSGDQTV